MIKKLLFFIILLVGLAVGLSLVAVAQRYFGRAAQKREIVVDASSNLGKVVPVWSGLAQGGEEKYPFTNVFGEISLLLPKYIRIDHIYDFYEVVAKDARGQLIFNWTALDRQVSDILATGALPFLSLSYMPSSIAEGGDLVARPVNWEDWSLVVGKTIEHFSGKDGKNLTDVAYEVWNEPDLFGGWRLGGVKDYRQLYRFAVLGAQKAQNTNPFKIGGPGITAPYKNWVGPFLDYVRDNNLRIDFYSWHRYSLKPDDYLVDVDAVDTWLFKNAGYTLEKYLTEWGPTSEKDPIYNSDFAAAHLVAVVSQLSQRLDLAFVFEIKDGLQSDWGLLTKEGNPKPRYQAIGLLNQLGGSQLKMEINAEKVYGLAAKSNQSIKIILANTGSGSQLMPLKILNLSNGPHSFKASNLDGQLEFSSVQVNGGLFQKDFLLPANSVLLLELE